MASDYPFRRVVGVELLPALHQIALENLAQYKSESQKCFALEALCGDASRTPFAQRTIVDVSVQPLPGIRIEARAHQPAGESPAIIPEPVYVLYHNPLLEHVLGECARLKKIGGTHQYSVWCAVGNDLDKSVRNKSDEKLSDQENQSRQASEPRILNPEAGERFFHGAHDLEHFTRPSLPPADTFATFHIGNRLGPQ